MRHGFILERRLYDTIPIVESPRDVRVRMHTTNSDGIEETLVRISARKPFNVRREVDGVLRVAHHNPSHGYTPNGFLAEEAAVSDKVGSSMPARLAESANHPANVMCRVCESQYGRIVHVKKLCLCQDCEKATIQAIKRDRWDEDYAGESHAVRNKTYLEYLRKFVGVTA